MSEPISHQGMYQYAAITFSPVQGFIEKTRKLRDLYGASIILSYLSQSIVLEAKNIEAEVISPGLVHIAKGMPNRILLRKKEGEFNPDELKQWVRETLLTGWKKICNLCKTWIEKKIPESNSKTFYHWDRDWDLWKNHTWEVFWGVGSNIVEAMEDLENNKLCRDWTGVNWIGESSSITGTDAIAWPGLGKGTRNPKHLKPGQEKQPIADFYKQLSTVLETKPGQSPDTIDTPEGKFLAPNERLSIPELVKRLITRDDIRKSLEKKIPHLERFTDLVRKPDTDTGTPGQWTGWFMGDGDEVGKHLKKLASDPEGDKKISQFSEAMRNWGEQFSTTFNPENIGRIIYAGGDDFLGVIYSKDPNQPISPSQALDWLMKLPDEWKKHGENITLSVGFVWAGHGVPQRDILQHCREAEKRSKSLGRKRLTLRVVFNSGQFVQWTCPWDHLSILKQYRDRDGGKNWGHIYNDFAQLKARHAINFDSATGKADYRLARSLMNIYFDQAGDDIFNNQKYIVDENDSSPIVYLNWVSDLIHVGWQLYSDVE
ncbi:MAG: type III-B CRISPR-associated protein Cas10/Cmr2 [Cyanobacteria bacterium J06592_8]